MSIPLPRPPMQGPIPGMGLPMGGPPPMMGGGPLPQPPMMGPGGMPGMPMPPMGGPPPGPMGGMPPGIMAALGPMMGPGGPPPMGGPGMPPPGMQPGLMSPPPEPPPPDPLSDPMILQLLYQRYEEDQEKEKSKKGPFHPAWYEDNKEALYPKPDLTEMTTKATNDQNLWREKIDLFKEDIDLLSPETKISGVYKDFDAENEEAWFSSALVAEKNLIKSKVGAIDPLFEVDSEYSSEKADDVQIIEDFMYAIDQEADRQYANITGSVRKLDIVDNALTYGRMVQRNLPDWKAEPGQVPFIMTLMDPATVFPTRDVRGIATVTCIYSKTIREVLHDHPECSKAIQTKLLRKQSDGSKRDMDDTVQVTEFWNRRWFGLIVEGKLIKEPYEHDLGEPPFVYTLVPRGNAANTNTPSNTGNTGQAGSTSVATKRDIKNQGVSFAQYRKRGHAQKERILSALDTQVRIKTNQPLIIEQDDFAIKNGMPEITGGPGGRSQIWRGHEEAKPYPTAPLPGEFGPLLQASQEDLSRDAMPPSSYGLTPGTQTSGFAIESLGESGLDKMTYELMACEQFHRDNMEQCLRFFRDWGHLLGSKGKRGYLKVRARRPLDGKPNVSEITPYTIRQFEGCLHISAKMTSLRLQNLAPLANALNLVRQGWGGITRYDAIKMANLPGARDPIATMREVDLEEIKQIPEYKLAKLYQWIIEDEDNPALAEFIYKQRLLAQAKDEAQNQRQMPPGAAGGGPAQVPGMSLPALGQPPGPGSGPQGPTNPLQSRPPGMA